jgi:hypothetical protein
MRSLLLIAVALLVFACLIVACLTGCSMAPPPGSPETGYTVTGYVGKSSALPAINENVLLLDGETGKPVDSAQTNWMGKYTFSGVKPGSYVVEAGSVQRKVLVKAESQRLDLDLSAKDGVMDYTKTGSLKSGKSGGTSGPQGASGSGGPKGGDASLVQAMAANYWGYSGSTETRLALCPDGTFYDFSESGYSGGSYDSGGNQTMSWGSASQASGKGTWTIEGDTQRGTITLYYSGGKQQTVEYQPGDDRGCYYFSGRQMCQTGEPTCQ